MQNSGLQKFGFKKPKRNETGRNQCKKCSGRLISGITFDPLKGQKKLF